MEVKTTEEKKGTRLKHVRQLNLSFSPSKPESGSVPLAACDCDNYKPPCEHLDLDHGCAHDCGIWG